MVAADEVRHLRHVTLDTGHVRDSPRAEVAASVIAALQPLLERAIGGERVPLPAGVEPPCTITAAAEAGCAIVTVWGPGPDQAPIATCGIVPGGVDGEGRRRCRGRWWGS